MSKVKPQGGSQIGYFVLTTLFVLIFVCSGCGNKFFDPTQVGRFNHTPTVNVILETLGVAEENPVAWEQGEEPRPIDTIAIESDYTFMSGDIIRIIIYELLGRGIPFEQEFIVSETGKISIPYAGELQVKGLTETELEGLIKQTLTPNTLIDPLVTVTLLQSQQRTYSILGEGVARPNIYQIPRYDYRLLEAFTAAGGAVQQDNVSFIHVIRKVSQSDQSSKIINEGMNDYKPIQSAYDFAQNNSTESLRRRQKQSNFSAGKMIVSSSEMGIGDDSDSFRRDFDQFYSGTQRRIGGTGTYQISDMSSKRGFNDDSDSFLRDFDRFFYGTQRRVGGSSTYQISDMPSGQNIAGEPVSVEEVLRRMSGETVGSNGTSDRIDIDNTIEPYRQSTLDNGVAREPVNNNRTQEYLQSDTEQTNRIEWVEQDGVWVPLSVESSAGTETEIEDEQFDWETIDGRWGPVRSGQPRGQITGIPGQTDTGYIPATRDAETQEFPWIEQTSQTRLIKIPIDRLVAGDPRYDIVIKPGDTINVPVDVAGVFYLMGNVNRTGPVKMIGGKMTLKQAIASAGNLGPLAWPKRCEIIRRVGRNKEEIVRVDLEKIFNGEQPDFYIKPHDIINVGTHATARWRAILRNAFRATYGFGFVYDRNFADRDFYTSRPFSMF